MWTITQSESGYRILRDDDGQYLVAFKSEDIARRIVASVNACAGISIEALEHGKVVISEVQDEEDSGNAI